MNCRVTSVFIKTSAPEERPLAYFSLPATNRTAATHVATRIDRHVADFACEPRPAVDSRPVDDDAAADPDLTAHVDHVAGTFASPETMLSKGANVSVVPNRHRYTIAESSAHELGKRHCRFGAVMTVWPSEVTVPATATPTPTTRRSPTDPSE